MKKFLAAFKHGAIRVLAALKHGAVRVWPLALAAAGAIVASSSFRHYVQLHPQFDAFIPVVVWLLHAASAAKNPPAKQ